MFQFFTSFGASTGFERCRLEITAKTWDGPSEQAIRNIIKTFSGEDTETKSQIGFATIVKKILTSDSKNNWVYLLKNLIILDKLVEENLLLEEISTVALATVEGFKESEQKNFCFDSERLVRTFWKLIREKSAVTNSNQHIFCFKRSHRADFLSKLTTSETLKQLQSIEAFFALTFQFVGYLSGSRLLEENPEMQDKIIKARQQFSRSRLMQYLNIQILHKLTFLYSCQLLCNNNFITLLKKSPNSVKQQDIRRYKRYLSKFKQNANEYITFVENRKHIKGFEQVNYKEFNPIENEGIWKLLDQFIIQKQSEGQKQGGFLDGPNLSKSQMKVETKPFGDLGGKVIVPRVSFKQIYQSQENINTAFTNWLNSCSDQFPQNQIMSVDLIIQIKKEESDKDAQQILIIQSNRQSCVYQNRDSTISTDFQITQHFIQKMSPSKFIFQNIFSSLGIKWNI